MITLFALIGGLAAGYLLGRLDELMRLLKRPESKSFVASVARDEKSLTRRKVDIDDSKYVVDVSTEGMKSSGEQSLGEIVKSSDDITTASNKLAQLKKLKG